MEVLLRTTPNIGDLLTPLETAVRYNLILALTGKVDLNGQMRRIIALPTRQGGLGMEDPKNQSHIKYQASRKVYNPITELILQQSGQPYSDASEKQRQAKGAVMQEKRQSSAEASRVLLEELPDYTKQMVNLTAEKDASNWLSALPVAEHGFFLHKSAFMLYA